MAGLVVEDSRFGTEQPDVPIIRHPFEGTLQRRDRRRQGKRPATPRTTRVVSGVRIPVAPSARVCEVTAAAGTPDSGMAVRFRLHPLHAAGGHSPSGVVLRPRMGQSGDDASMPRPRRVFESPSSHLGAACGPPAPLLAAVPEWPKETSLKLVGGSSSVGSNPTCGIAAQPVALRYERRHVRVAQGARQRSVCAKARRGSTPRGGIWSSSDRDGDPPSSTSLCSSGQRDTVQIRVCVGLRRFESSRGHNVRAG